MSLSRLPLPAMLATLALAAAGGALAWLAGLPLPWLLGAQVAVSAAALAGVTFFGAPPTWPENSRLLFIPVLGVMIGGAFTADVVSQIPGWWVTALCLFVFLLISHWCVYWLYRRIGGYDVATAYYSSAPGGFIEAVVFGTEAGGNGGIIAALQFSRILISVFIIPILFAIALGHAVGSAAGMSLNAGGAASLTLNDWLLLGLAGLVGGVLGRWLKLPAGILSGPILFSAIVHLAGWTQSQPPALLIAVTQLVIGTSLGVRFVGMAHGEVLRAIALASAGVVTMLVLAMPFAWFLAGYAEGGFPVLLLAFAPGGVAEMSLIALSLGLSVPFVTVHHLLRILLAITFVPLQFRLRFGRPGSST